MMRRNGIATALIVVAVVIVVAGVGGGSDITVDIIGCGRYYWLWTDQQ
jgi:hypothetical protein